MKAYLILFFVALTIIPFSSCKKCKTCEQTLTTTTNQGGSPQVSHTTFDACGQDLKDVDGKTITATSTSGSVTATTVSKTVCKE